jgi:hypothetical protein
MQTPERKIDAQWQFEGDQKVIKTQCRSIASSKRSIQEIIGISHQSLTSRSFEMQLQTIVRRYSIASSTHSH